MIIIFYILVLGSKSGAQSSSPVSLRCAGGAFFLTMEPDGQYAFKSTKPLPYDPKERGEFGGPSIPKRSAPEVVFRGTLKAAKNSDGSQCIYTIFHEAKSQLYTIKMDFKNVEFTLIDPDNKSLNCSMSPAVAEQFSGCKVPQPSAQVESGSTVETNRPNSKPRP